MRKVKKLEVKGVKFLQQFRDFAMRGNVIDMAVGIIIGSAFGKIVSSLVDDILMPPLGYVLGRVDFSNLTITLRAKTDVSPAVTIGYGAFINTIVSFTIIAFAMFILIRQVNRIADTGKKPVMKDCPYCFSKILKKASRCPECTSQLVETTVE